jgi:hypothetical protein
VELDYTLFMMNLFVVCCDILIVLASFFLAFVIDNNSLDSLYILPVWARRAAFAFWKPQHELIVNFQK